MVATKFQGYAVYLSNRSRLFTENIFVVYNNYKLTMECSIEIFSGVSRLFDARTGNRNGNH